MPKRKAITATTKEQADIIKGIIENDYRCKVDKIVKDGIGYERYSVYFYLPEFSDKFGGEFEAWIFDCIRGRIVKAMKKEADDV